MTIETPLEHSIEAVDLFCGAGGLTYGLQEAGIKVTLGIDIDKDCAYPYQTNNKTAFLLKSVDTVQGNEIEKYYHPGMIKVLAGCAPCQTFSKYNQKATESDGRWWLLRHFARLVEAVKPQIVTMENVPGLQKKGVFEEFKRALKKEGYNVSDKIVKCAEYGIPQDRTRLVLLASKLGPIELLPKPNYKTVTVYDAIGHLPPIKAGEIWPDDPLHRSSRLSGKNTKRIRASRPGGNWKSWPAELIAECHKKGSGKTYSSVYGRMCWDRVSPTITTEFFGFGNGRFGHPDQDRAISLREGAILQSFPRDYRFTPPGSPICYKKVGRLIGNAVPVRLGHIIGQSILEHVTSWR